MEQLSMEQNRMLGEFIAQRRKSLGLTQKELAAKVGVSDKAVSKWETLEANPDISLLLPLSELLQVSVEELLRGELIEREETPESQLSKSEGERGAEEKPAGISGKKAVAAYFAFVVLSVILGFLTLFALISLALVGKAKPEDQTALFVVFTVLLVLFGTAFILTVTKAVSYHAELHEIPTDQKEVGGYIIYKNLSKAEKKALLQERKKTSVVFLCLGFCLGLGFACCWLLRLFYDNLAVQICTLVFAVAILVVELLETVLRVKWMRKNKIITTRRQYDRIDRR